MSRGTSSAEKEQMRLDGASTNGDELTERYNS